MGKDQDKTVQDILEAIPIFQGLTRHHLKMIVPLLQELSFPPDTVVIKEGTSGRSMYIIISGTVKVTKGGDDGEDILIVALYGGSYFGELSLIDNMPRSASITTIEETKIFKLKKESFDSLLARENEIANIFYKNCLTETFSRFRNNLSNFTFSQHILQAKTSILNEINKDLSLAKKVQNYFLNTKSLDSEETTGWMRHSYVYHPCSEIGGDFINIAHIDDNFQSIIIADVMGHGITAALATGVLKSAFTIAVADMGRKPVELLHFLNGHILNVVSELYATCYYALIDRKKKQIVFAKAGHHHPLFWKARQKTYALIDCTGNGLGLMKDAKFSQTVLPFEEGDKLLFFTDGIIEQTDSRREMYSETRLRSVFSDLILRGEKNILNAVFADLKIFTGDIAYEDDITMLLLEF